MIVVVGSHACARDGDISRWPRDGHRSALAALNSIDLSTIPDPVLIDLILSVRWNAEQSLSLVNQIRKYKTIDAELSQVISRLEELGKASRLTLNAVSKRFPAGVNASWRNA
jgi:hypothetical protein